MDGHLYVLRVGTASGEGPCPKHRRPRCRETPGCGLKPCDWRTAAGQEHKCGRGGHPRVWGSTLCPSNSRCRPKSCEHKVTELYSYLLPVVIKRETSFETSCTVRRCRVAPRGRRTGAERRVRARRLMGAVSASAGEGPLHPGLVWQRPTGTCDCRADLTLTWAPTGAPVQSP